MDSSQLPSQLENSHAEASTMMISWLTPGRSTYIHTYVLIHINMYWYGLNIWYQSLNHGKNVWFQVIDRALVLRPWLEASDARPPLRQHNAVDSEAWHCDSEIPDPFRQKMTRKKPIIDWQCSQYLASQWPLKKWIYPIKMVDLSIVMLVIC